MGFLNVFLRMYVCLYITCGIFLVPLFSTRYRWLILLYKDPSVQLPHVERLSTPLVRHLVAGHDNLLACEFHKGGNSIHGDLMWIVFSQPEQLTEQEPAIEVIHDCSVFVFPITAVLPLSRHSPRALWDCDCLAQRLLPHPGGPISTQSLILKLHDCWPMRSLRSLTPPLEVGLGELSRDFRF